MKAENFQCQEWVSGKTSAELKNVRSYRLYVNNILFSSNLPCIDRDEGQLLQLEVCDQCFTPGCCSGGYVQILVVKDYIIWKAPLPETIRESFTSQYSPAQALKHGSIFWPKELYLKFISYFGEPANSIKLLQNQISYNQAYDLWKLQALNSMCPAQNRNFSFKDIGKRIVAVHSENFDDSQCLEVYKHAIYLWKDSKINNFASIPSSAKKITFYFNVKDFNQWDCLFLGEEKIYFPIGDGYGWEINKKI